MVSWRRSAADPVAMARAGPAAGDSAEPNVALLARTPAPHSEQKRSSGRTACPQFGQARGRTQPHLLQNLLPSTISTLQPGHCKVPNLLTFIQYRRTKHLEGRFCRLTSGLGLAGTNHRSPTVCFPVPGSGCLNRYVSCQRARVTLDEAHQHVLMSIFDALIATGLGGTVRHAQRARRLALSNGFPWKLRAAIKSACALISATVGWFTEDLDFMNRQHELDSRIAWSGESGQPQFGAELFRLSVVVPDRRMGSRIACAPNSNDEILRRRRGSHRPQTLAPVLMPVGARPRTNVTLQSFAH